MEPVETLALPAAAQWETLRLDEATVRQIVLEEYDAEHASLLRYVAWLGVDADTARDVVHDCFLKLYEHLLGRGDRTNLRAWLYRVAHNSVRNRQVSFESRKAEPLSDLEGVNDPVTTSASPEDRLLAQERDAALGAAIGGLSQAQRECLVLRAQGLKYREIADVMGLSVSTVAENTSRGLERLKKAL